MEVKLLAHTIDPAKTVAVAGKGCYSDWPAYDIRLTSEGVDHTLEVIHPSCYEHAVFTFSISGISRVTSHQLVRHRMASYSQQSQRYVKPKNLDKHMLFDYVTPESISEDGSSAEQYEWAMWVIDKVYRQMLGWGVPEEDARYILPNACTTSIVVTMNARELQHFCGLRRCKRAQWEIRELADKMAQAAEEACPELFKHFSLGPQCEQLGYCPEHKSCGKAKTLDRYLRYDNKEYQFSQLREAIRSSLDNKVVFDWTEPKYYTVQKGKGIIGEVRETEVTDKTRTAEEYREDGYEDLAQQKERAEDAVAVAKSVVEKSDVPRCPKCGTPLSTERRMMDPDLRRGMSSDSKYTIGCPCCQVWYSSSISTEMALKRFMECWEDEE